MLYEYVYEGGTKIPWTFHLSNRIRRKHHARGYSALAYIHVDRYKRWTGKSLGLFRLSNRIRSKHHACDIYGYEYEGDWKIPLTFLVEFKFVALQWVLQCKHFNISQKM